MNKLFIKILTLLLLISMFAFGIAVGCDGCDDPEEPNPGPETEVPEDDDLDYIYPDSGSTFALTLNKTSIDALVGDVYTLVVTNVASASDIKWSTNNKDVATVENGKIEAMGVGTAVITATYLDTYAATCTVNVSFGSEIPYLVVKNANSKFTIGKMQTAFPFEVSVFFNGKEFTDVNVTCESAGTIITCGQNGVLTPTGTLGTEDVRIKGSWRGYTSLLAIVSVTVQDEVFFWVNDNPVADISLSTFAVPGKDDEVSFNVKGFFNGTPIAEEDIVITTTENIVKYENKTIKAVGGGKGKVYLSYTANKGTPNETILTQSVDVIVDKVKGTSPATVNYFSSNLGTYKDHNDGWQNKSIINALEAEYSDDKYAFDTAKAFINGDELIMEDGKLLGLPLNHAGAYEAVVTFETDSFIVDVPIIVYGLVIKEAQDLKNLELKVIRNDDHNTPGVDETQVTCIDGYVALVDNIDASSIKLEHTAMYTKYQYRQDWDHYVEKTITTSRYMYSNPSRTVVADHLNGKFGFIGNFDGCGYTISNLDVSTTAGDSIGGAGVFGWTMGATTIKNVAFTNFRCDYSCGLVNESRSWGGHSVPVDPLGLRIGAPTIRDVYIKLSTDTVNPKGVICRDGAGRMYNKISNIVIDGTGVVKGTETVGGLYVYVEGAACPWNAAMEFYYTCANIFIIGEYPAYFNTNDTVVTILGRNCAQDETWLRLREVDLVSKGAPADTRYAYDYYTYDTVNALKADKAKYDNFSAFSNSVWSLTSGTPVFKTV